jgi:hypothetical protein
MPHARRWLRRVVFAGQSRARPMALERRWPSAGTFWDLAERALDDGAPHLAWALRSDVSLWPQFGGVASILASLVGRPLARRLAFGGGEDALVALGLIPQVSGPPIDRPTDEAADVAGEPALERRLVAR